ncbi:MULTISPECIES: double-strand break repair protein AddB [unclassified Aminobacter]|uniref:double-strand break repair protein AddB n=1 Tax=unclassified Aminobacter TaxID=2644704 RepID=UPI0004630663|nr:MULTISPECIES: double-strand break repair protein AddB [unclassified Aminobacter]TWH36284.1 ATP-dependent helicase/nuclease subunit B [Aminobacter sp. J15]
MTARVLSIPPGAPFLQTLAASLLDGTLIPGFSADGSDPLRLVEATIYVPTRRAARALRDEFVEQLGGVAAILPTIRPLGEFDEDADIFEGSEEDELSLNPPIGKLDRILLLAPLVQAWKKRLPAHVAAMFGEDVVVPASLADAIWLARDLAGLMDEVETGGADWKRLANLVPEDLANWWQVTLEFLDIVSRAWPALLAERARSNPAAHRNAMIRAEAERLLRNPPRGPVIAAGSTGSIPATAQLLKSIALLPNGAVVLPGLDLNMDEEAWKEVGMPGMAPATFGHPQSTLKKLLATLGIERRDVIEIGEVPADLAARIGVINEALRPAETTDLWVERAGSTDPAAFADVTLVEAANEREEALSVAVALRLALEKGTAAFVTGDRELARRVAMELRRFGIEADDSGGTPLTATPPATLLSLMLEAVFRPGDAVTILALAKHPLLHAGFARSVARQAAETLDLVALRGGVGRPDISRLSEEFERRYQQRYDDPRKPVWWLRLNEERLEQARLLAAALEKAIAPLCTLRDTTAPLSELVRLTVECLEALGRDDKGSVTELYRGDAGDRLASFLRSLAGVEAELEIEATEWPDVLNALISGESVKASVTGDSRVSIWGALEARLQSVDTLVLGGLNEGSWPRKAEPDRFMSRFMKSDLELDPPEKRIGQAAHDFVLAMGTRKVILTRAARSGDAPAIASRWLQRLETFAGKEIFEQMRQRGNALAHWARELDVAPPVKFATRPNPTPPLDMRPTRFSVTEIETLRRDAYAIYARRILGLEALEPLLRDPGAAERGNLFHDIVHEFTVSGIDPDAPLAEEQLLKIGRKVFDEAELPLDVDAVWWPRFARMATHFIEWERNRPPIKRRISETRASETPIGSTGATLRGRADRIDLLAGGMADIIDFKTGSSPSKAQAHTLLSPQLALEGALLRRGAFTEVGTAEPSQLAYVRMKPNGEVIEESILEYKPTGQEKSIKSGVELSEEAWARLEEFIAHFAKETTGYLSRALPFREGDVGGDYDHLARVLEWSAGGDNDAGGGDGE